MKSKVEVHSFDSFGGGSEICFSARLTAGLELEDGEVVADENGVVNSSYDFFWSETDETVLGKVRHALNHQVFKEIPFMFSDGIDPSDFHHGATSTTLWVTGAFTFEKKKWVLTDIFAIGACDVLEKPYDE
jgi:hypothetical protein